MIEKKHRYVLWFWIGAVLLVYLIAMPANRTEAEDDYDFAGCVENLAFPTQLHAHHLVYAPLMRIAYCCVHAVFPSVRSFPVMVAASLISGCAALLIFVLFCERIIGATFLFSLVAAGWLAFSYGYWRYSVEAEVYGPAFAVGLFALYWCFKKNQGNLWATFAGTLCGIGVLFHIMNGLILLPLGLHLFRQRRLKAFAVIVLSCFLIIGISYGASWALSWRYIINKQVLEASHSSSSPVQSPGNASGKLVRTLGKLIPPSIKELGPSRLVTGAIALAQDFVSGNYLFCYPVVQRALVNKFPYKMLAEEIFAGQHAPRIVKMVAPLLNMALLVVALLILFNAHSRSAPSERRTGPSSALFLVWTLAYAAVELLLDPSAPESWLLILLPVFLFIASVLSKQRSSQQGVLLVLSILLLVLSNYFGGFALLQSKNGDYNYRKANFIINRAKQGDFIATAENPVFVRYLRYHTKATVIDLWTCGDLDTLRFPPLDLSENARLYILGDVLMPPASMKYQLKEAYLKFPSFIKKISPGLSPVHLDEMEPVYVYMPQGTSSFPQHHLDAVSSVKHVVEK